MIINGKNYLLLEKRGCNFCNNDEIKKFSDVGNYRVFVEFIDKKGVKVCGDLNSYNVRDYNKKGKPIIKYCAIHTDFTQRNSAGCFVYNPEIKAEKYTYNMNSIIDYINELSIEKYDDYKFSQSFAVYVPSEQNFTPNSLIYDYAKKHHLETFYCFDSLRVKMYTGEFKYLSYKIEQAKNGLNKVTVYLESVSN